ncbi:MAG: glutamate--cysteine ligase [Gammaproteobacteria bacterium]|nr:glutamate--cysteine ligase [Gammaproteobacteria bacterium]
MSKLYARRIQRLRQQDCTSLFAGGLRGIERECLRINGDGSLAQTPHPAALGSPLTHRYITTDYSESLLEFVTPPQQSTWEVMQCLFDLHQFTTEQLNDELLWPFSMPCGLTSEAEIPLALYGSSNIGKMKTLYRQGLGHRYGRFMQVISGLHLNYSLPEHFWPLYQELEGATGSAETFRSDAYMGLVRNVRRYDWLILYLFGASPAVCKSFLRDAGHSLQQLDARTAYGPYATSLRMSGVGYQNTSQSAVHVSANSLDEYVRDLSLAIETPSPEWERLGLKLDGEYLQLNTNQLQIENEFYSSVRPKRVAETGERPSKALQRGGIEYVELRVLDVSPFDPVGINQAEIRFNEIYLVYCMLQDSPAITAAAQQRHQANRAAVAGYGRQPGLRLATNQGSVSMQDWALELLEDMQPVAEMLDCNVGEEYRQALAMQIAVAGNPELTPSARMLDELQQSGLSFIDYGLQVATINRDYFRSQAPEHNVHRPELVTEADASFARQHAIEKSDAIDFDAYIARYYS